jgi:hypothetical protein
MKRLPWPNESPLQKVFINLADARSDGTVTIGAGKEDQVGFSQILGASRLLKKGGVMTCDLFVSRKLFILGVWAQ